MVELTNLMFQIQLNFQQHFSGYFLFLNSGIDIFPTVATVAAEDPEIAANKAHPTTFTWISPPGNFASREIIL